MMDLHLVYKDFNYLYKKHKKDYIIKKLKEFHTKNSRTPYCRDFIDNPDYPSSSTITNLFGTFNNVLLASELNINTFANLPFNEFGTKNNLPSYHWVNNHFGSYENLIIHLENSIEPNF